MISTVQPNEQLAEHMLSVELLVNPKSHFLFLPPTPHPLQSSELHILTQNDARRVAISAPFAVPKYLMRNKWKKHKHSYNTQTSGDSLAYFSWLSLKYTEFSNQVNI